MYPQEIVLPMKAELTDNGFEDLDTPALVDEYVQKDGTTLVMINSVCGCSAGSASRSPCPRATARARRWWAGAATGCRSRR